MVLRKSCEITDRIVQFYIKVIVNMRNADSVLYGSDGSPKGLCILLIYKEGC